jgi:hypothetical protein
MPRLSVILHGTLGSYLRAALQEGGAAVVACLPAPTSEAYVPLFLFRFSSLLVDSTAFFLREFELRVGGLQHPPPDLETWDITFRGWWQSSLKKRP